jgi:hypothetical protein
MRTRCLLLLLTCVAGLWAGCETGEGSLPPPKTTTDLILTPDARQVLATLRVGSALRVILPPPALPGYQWEIVANPGKQLRQITGLRPVPDAPGKLAVTFQSAKAMRSQVLFVAIKPGQPEATVEESFAITVGVSDAPPKGPSL